MLDIFNITMVNFTPLKKPLTLIKVHDRTTYNLKKSNVLSRLISFHH